MEFLGTKLSLDELTTIWKMQVLETFLTDVQYLSLCSVLCCSSHKATVSQQVSFYPFLAIFSSTVLFSVDRYLLECGLMAGLWGFASHGNSISSRT